MAASACLPFCALLVLCVGAILAKNVDTRPRRQSDIEPKPCDTMVLYFDMKNITISGYYNETGKVCGGHCCDSATELLLKEQGRKDFAQLLRHNSRSLLGPISRVSSLLQHHVWESTYQSENYTLELLSHIYRYQVSKEPIQILYQTIRDFLIIDPNDQKPVKSPQDITDSVNGFFAYLFPLAYHQQADTSAGDFTPKYKQCLKDNMDIIVPFGDSPTEMAESLTKSLEATRLLLQAFSIGIEVLNTTDALIIDEQSTTSTECHAALLKMTYCSKCLGYRHSKPCSGYCLNVLRGCISKYVAELDLPWNSYVEGIENLVNAMKRTSNNPGANVNVEVAIRNLATQVSTAIMYCMEKIVDVDKKVKMTCKIPEFVRKPESLTAETTTLGSVASKTRQPNSRAFSHFMDVQMTTFLSVISKTKGFYADLADNLCGEESFAEQRDKKCWNGERVAEYTKTIALIGPNSQKYNPEVKVSSTEPHVMAKIATLVDKLRHVHHMAVSSLGQNYADIDMQRDGVDGSGSGNGPGIDDDEEYSRGSGSGHGPIEPDEGNVARKSDEETDTIHNNINEQTPTVQLGSGCSDLRATTTLITILTILALFPSRH